jgi:hypothetical protein
MNDQALTPAQAIKRRFQGTVRSWDGLIEANSLNRLAGAQYLVTLPRMRSALRGYIRCSLNLGFRTEPLTSASEGKL